MKKVIILKGVSGSGKTTWANEYKRYNPNTVIVTKDDIRGTISKESKVIEKRNELIIEALEKGKDVISADTNLNPIHIKNITSLVYPKYKDEYEVVIEDFTKSVPVEVCIERCVGRPEGKDFWKKVIMKQKDDWLVPEKLYKHPDYYKSDLPKIFLADMDGTTSFLNGRVPYDASTCHNDLPNEALIDIFKRTEYKLIFFSGREDKDRVPTENWLYSQGIVDFELYMRKTGDSRNDAIVKRELYEAVVKDKYLVMAVFDDRPRVVRLWVELGLPIFAFGNPYHEF